MDMKPIFIVGCGRTGSRIYKQILNNHPDIHISGEVHLKNPWYKLLRRDNYSKLKRFRKHPNKLVKLCFSGKLNGNFWRQIQKDFKDYQKKELEKKYSSSDRTIKTLIQMLLEENSKMKNASIFGSKFPLHFYYTPILKKWWPDAKIIHVTRDPRAILASELNKGKKRKPNYPISERYSLLYDIGIIFYVLVQWAWSAKFHHYFDEIWSESYKLFKYEDMISNPEKKCRDLANFVNIEFEEKLLNIEVIGSSFNEGGPEKYGFDETRIYRWKKVLSKRKTKLMNLLLSRQMKRMGYTRI